jgi:hypothetical protein
MPEIGGLTAGGEYDQLNFSGTGALDGVLTVTLLGGFQPLEGNVFTILPGGTLTGAFDIMNLPALSPGLAWQYSQTATAATPRSHSRAIRPRGIAHRAGLCVRRAPHPSSKSQPYSGRQDLKTPVGSVKGPAAVVKGFAAAVKRPAMIVKELNAILTKKLHTTDPVLLGVWKVASRLEQPPRRTETAPLPAPATTDNSTAGSGEAAAEPSVLLEATRPPAGGDKMERKDAAACFQNEMMPAEAHRIALIRNDAVEGAVPTVLLRNQRPASFNQCGGDIQKRVWRRVSDALGGNPTAFPPRVRHAPPYMHLILDMSLTAKA